MLIKKLVMLVLPVCAASLMAHASDLVVVWRDPGPMATLNLLYGSGGRAHAPDARGRFTFVTEDELATSPKFDIADQHGVEWKVKLGEEPQSETAASRLMWAAGYFVDEDYYLAEFTVTGLPELHRGGQFVTPGGRVHGGRLERKLKGVARLGTWDWFDNPLIGTRELNGLRIMMSLLNNWDLKEVNNTILQVGGERRYIVTDLGATFGNTGNSLTRSKSALGEYAASKFIDKVEIDSIDFVLHSRPFILSAINIPNYQTRTRMEDITRKIPRADARWLARRLSRLSDRQIGDAFRAGGYTREEIAVYSRAIRKRIMELAAL